MPELPYPHYKIQADGPNETGCVMTVVISDGVGGPLPGTTAKGIVEDLARRLAGEDGDVTVSLVRTEISATSLR
ncbi:hypothetical protein [Streptomyces silaceus]|uniref:hypothetical protein n=1 Tax=Streptomyces silaceus TaxID=545123 RepID=UPI0006EB2B29|nr:hypothetical protein [Streptomyces silaceus]